MSEMFEAAEEELEELFPPKKGGLVDRHRARKAAEAAQAQEAENAQEPIEQASYRAVKTAPESPEIFSVNIVSVPAGGSAPVLPGSPYRYRATVRIPPQSNAQASLAAEGSVTNPGAFATIANITGVPNGTYQVTATVYLSGTVTAADANNMLVTAGGTPIRIAYPGVANVPVTFTTVFTVNSGSILLQSNNAASGAAAVYNGAIVANPLPSVQPSVILAKDSSAALGGIGYPLVAGDPPLSLLSRGQLVAFNSGAAAVSVAVIAEIYAPEK